VRDPSMLPSYFSGSTFAVGDLADSTNAERDSSVLYLCRKVQGQIFVVDCRFGRWGSAELVDQIIKVLLDPNCRPTTLYLEKTLGSEHLNNLILARANQMALPKVPIVWVKAGNRKGSKSLRIGNIQEALKSKRLWLFAGMPGFQKLVDQLLRWPRVKHDDLADCLGRCIEVPVGWETENLPRQSPIRRWWERTNNNDLPNDEYPDSGGGSGLCC
jgi:hypothetical protein